MVMKKLKHKNLLRLNILLVFLGLIAIFSSPVHANQFGGVGLLLDYYPPGSGQVVVYSVRYKSPADKAKIRRSYRLVSVDGQNVTGMSLEQIAGMIRGPVGTPVQLDFMTQQGQVRQYSLLRSAIAEKPEIRIPGVKGIAKQGGLNPTEKALLQQKIHSLQTQAQQMRMLELIKSFKNHQITKTQFLEALHSEFP